MVGHSGEAPRRPAQEEAAKVSVASRGPQYAHTENYDSEVRYDRQRMTQAWHQLTTGTRPQEHLTTEHVTGGLQSENPEQGSSNTSSWPFHLLTLLPLPHFQYSFTSTFIHIKMCFLDSSSNIRLIFDGIFLL